MEKNEISKNGAGDDRSFSRDDLTGNRHGACYGEGRHGVQMKKQDLPEKVKTLLHAPEGTTIEEIAKSARCSWWQAYRALKSVQTALRYEQGGGEVTACGQPKRWRILYAAQREHQA